MVVQWKASGLLFEKEVPDQVMLGGLPILLQRLSGGQKVSEIKIVTTEAWPQNPVFTVTRTGDPADASGDEFEPS